MQECPVHGAAHQDGQDPAARADKRARDDERVTDKVIDGEVPRVIAERQGIRHKRM